MASNWTKVECDCFRSGDNRAGLSSPNQSRFSAFDPGNCDGWPDGEYPVTWRRLTCFQTPSFACNLGHFVIIDTFRHSSNRSNFISMRINSKFVSNVENMTPTPVHSIDNLVHILVGYKFQIPLWLDIINKNVISSFWLISVTIFKQFSWFCYCKWRFDMM